MLVLNRVVKDRKAHARLVREIRAAAKRGAARGFNLPPHLHAEFVDAKEGEGGVVGDAFYITVPYEYAEHRVALKWFVGHELAHVWQANNGHTGRLTHDAEFYRALKVLCAPSALHYELRFRPQAARRAGIKRRLRRR